MCGLTFLSDGRPVWVHGSKTIDPETYPEFRQLGIFSESLGNLGNLDPNSRAFAAAWLEGLGLPPEDLKDFMPLNFFDYDPSQAIIAGDPNRGGIEALPVPSFVTLN